MIPTHIRPQILFISRLVLICAFLLFGVNLMTSTLIQNHLRQDRQTSFSKLLPTAASFSPYAKNRTLENASIIIGWDKAHKKTGYIISSTGHGYGGPIRLLVGFSGSKVTRIQILSHVETTGMGSLITHPEPMTGRAFTFQGQFNNKSIFDRFSTHEDIIALSGATITSQGVGDGILAAVKIYRRLENVQYED